jgi:hypothetical protein
MADRPRNRRRRTVTDTEFLRAFEDTTLEPFHHRDHLRATFLYLRQFGETETRQRLGPAILRYAAARNGAEKYHETITQAWIHLVSAALAEDFESMLAELLQSSEARARWIEPDRAGFLEPRPPGAVSAG